MLCTFTRQDRYAFKIEFVILYVSSVSDLPTYYLIVNVISNVHSPWECMSLQCCGGGIVYYGMRGVCAPAATLS